MTTNKNTMSVSIPLTELEREMVAASKLGAQDIGRSLGEYLIGTSGEFSPIPKNTARISVVDSETGLAVADTRVNDIEVSGCFASMKDKLVAVHFAELGTFETTKISSKKGFLTKASRFGGMLTMDARRFAKSRQWITLPVLAKTLCEGSALFYTGTIAQFKADLLAYFGYEFDVSEMVKWTRSNKEKGFKALSASTMVGTEYIGDDLVVVALPSIGPAGDGFGVMSNANRFVLQNEISLGELFQFRGNPISNIFGHIKGCVATLLTEHVLKVAELFFKADQETLKYIWVNIDRVLVTTTDMVKRQEPGIYAIARAALNCRGTKKERTSIILGQQAATRHHGAMSSEKNSLLLKSEQTLREIYEVLKESVGSPFTEVKRLNVLKLMKHAAIVLHSDDTDDEDDNSSPTASATQDFDEVYTILSRPGATLEEANRQGKLVEAFQSLIRSIFRTPQPGYAAYACPAEVVEIISGHKMTEGEIYLPKDVAKKMKWTKGTKLAGGRDPRLKHALVPYVLSGINTYLRCIAVKGYLGRLDLLHQMDFDGDTFTAVPFDVVEADFDAAVKAVIETVTAVLQWDKDGANVEALPCYTGMAMIELKSGNGEVKIKVANAVIIRPIFGTWDVTSKTFRPAIGEKPVSFSGYEQKDGSDCYYKILPVYVWGMEKDWPADIKDDVIATISAIASAKGIEMADALASRAAIDYGDMLSWDKVQFAQKVIEGCKHGSGGILPDVQKLSGPPAEGFVAASTMFFTLKSKTKGTGNRWIGHQEYLTIEGDDFGAIEFGAKNIESIIRIGWKLAPLMAKLAEMPRTGTLRCDVALPGPHDMVLAWVCGDNTLAHLANAMYRGADHSLHGAERLMHYYNLATMQRRMLRESLRTMSPDEARAYVESNTGAAMLTISTAKRATKARIHAFAQWLAFMHETGLRLPKPDGFKMCGGHRNAVYTDTTLSVISNMLRPAGLDWEPIKNGKVNPLYVFDAKYPTHYEALNKLIDSCIDEETALGILASYFFRVGTSPLADNGMPKSAYLYFVGEMVTVQMASLMTTKGKKFYCPVIDQNAALNEEGSP